MASTEVEDFVPRAYQVTMLEKAINKNTLLYLPTGSGKTFVAIMLLKKLCNKLDKPYTKGGKRSFFLVNTVALVGQQATSIKRHLPFCVGQYSGDMNVDLWDMNKWHEELDNYEIIVLTCQIFLNMLLHGYIRLMDCNVLIFDECHHAVNEHPMRMVMQQFEHCPVSEQPRVLGLTATLINRSIKVDRVITEVQSLEKTFHSQVATVDHISTVQRFSTNPNEVMITYTVSSETDLFGVIYSKIEDLQKTIEKIDFDCIDNVPLVLAPSGSRHLYDKRKTNKMIINILEDLRLHIGMFGLYGGAKSCLAHLIQLERWQCRAENRGIKGVLDMIITKLLLIKRIINDAVETFSSEHEQIYNYSSNKLLKLFQILKKFHHKSDMEFCCVIFVQRRFTAKVLYHILKGLISSDSDYSFIRPDFIVGFNNNPTSDTREGRLESKRNMEVLKKFSSKDHIVNLVVSSSVLEEGIDIPTLSLVVKFDFPSNHTSYIQSKGRARHVASNYVLMIPEDEAAKYHSRYSSFRAVEERLQALLVGQTSNRRPPKPEEIARELYEQELPPYVASEKTGSTVNMTSAIQLLNRYCLNLPQDKFTVLVPEWFLNKNGSVTVQMPINSPLRELITGKPFKNIKNAKRAAALETCIRLHKLGELDEFLLPRGCKSTLINDPRLFPFWRFEPIQEGTPKPGTKRMKRQYIKKFPDTLSYCQVMPGSTGYLHMIALSPIYPRPSINRRIVFYDLLKMDQEFAILSSKPMPEVCNFTIFMNVGEVKVNMAVNHSKVTLSEGDLEELQTFSLLVFSQVLQLEKGFLIFDLANKENSYIVVPMVNGNIDWETVRGQKAIPKVEVPSDDVRSQIHVDEGGYLHKVVAPWYRPVLPDQQYIVTRVCHDINPESPFPTPEYPSYSKYFIEKYQTQIIKEMQPLIEVKAISDKMHMIKPRTAPEVMAQSKRKRQQLNDDFEEHLVPELCVKYDFPAVLWLKATCLPTVLHRLVSLLLADELRATINKDIGIGVVSLLEGSTWDPLEMDASSTTTDKNKDALMGVVNNSVNRITIKARDPHWGNDKEPIDIERCRLEDVRLVEIQYYEMFINKSLPTSPVKGAAPNQDIPVKKIAILQAHPQGIGPQQADILKALTSTTANDVFNLERLETLGDSFLKFAVSQFLFQNHMIDEGKLTLVKGKLLGNRNLLYCAEYRNLGSLMKVYDFFPKSDWTPPKMCVPRFLQEIMNQTTFNSSPNILHTVKISSEERKTGKLENATVANIISLITEAPREEAQFQNTMEVFLNRLTIPDKTVSDGVEALIGAYLKSTGVRGALLLLGWLGVLPADVATPHLMFDVPPPTALLDPSRNDVDFHICGLTSIESQLGYTFKDRSFLLQALTHPSYSPNRITDNYQRLEFLGDALLDFLVTCHIYESCGTLTPGELTDLRSSLVNNITFASLVVRNGLHKYLLAQSPKLMDIIDKFVQAQEDQNFTINESVLYLIGEDDAESAEAVDVPKVLGDLLESLAGAIYLDSNMSLSTVWDVFYRLMHKEIEEFSSNVPKHPIRLLYEFLGQNKPEFKKALFKEDKQCIMVSVEVLVNGEKRSFTGYGANKQLAKMAAAKVAMRELGRD